MLDLLVWMIEQYMRKVPQWFQKKNIQIFVTHLDNVHKQLYSSSIESIL